MDSSRRLVTVGGSGGAESIIKPERDRIHTQTFACRLKIHTTQQRSSMRDKKNAYGIILFLTSGDLNEMVAGHQSEE